MKKKILYLLSFVLMLGVAVAGCNSEKTDKEAAEPRAINEATDKCENCKMAVADNSDATEIVLKDGKVLVFDDIGCMVNKWMRSNGTDDVEAAFVRSHHDKEWLDYEEAVYVFDPKITTAMGYGVIAFKDEAGAQKFIDNNGMGEVMTKAELDEHDWPQDKSNMTMHKQGDMNHGDDMHMDDEGMTHEE